MERNLLLDVSAVYLGHVSPAALSGEPSQILNRCPPPRRLSAPPAPRREGRTAYAASRQRRRQAAALAGLLASAALVSGGCTGNHRPATPAAQAGAKVGRGTASWYGSEFNGRRTASGERYDMRSLTAAHPNLPFGSLVQVTNLDNGRQVVVRINDRGPFGRRRVIDVSYAAARQLGMVGPGTARVELAVLPAAPPTNRYDPAAQPFLLAAIGAPPPEAAPVAAPAESPPPAGQPIAPAPSPPLADKAAVAAQSPPLVQQAVGAVPSPPLAGQPAPSALVPADSGASAMRSEAAGAVTTATRTPAPTATRMAVPAHYTVQVGAFGEIERAGELQQRLARRYPEAAVHSDGIWNRVQVGLFGDREEAEALRREITELGLAAVVVAAR
jgi:rare lipoprotein A